MKAALIIPARDESATIGAVVRAAKGLFTGDVIVVDNGSSDDTAEQARLAGARVVDAAASGYGRACMAGVAACHPENELILFMDGDGSDHPEDIAALIRAIDSGADLALAVRRGPGVERGSIAPAARFGNWLSGSLIGLLWGRRLHDLSPLKAIRADALRAIDPRERTYGWTVELLAGAVALGLEVAEVPAGYRKRAGGESKVSGQFGPSLRAGTRILATLGRAWWRRPPPVRSGIGFGLIAGVALVAAFAAWLATAGPESFGVYAAAVLISWPVLLLTVLTGAAVGSLASSARRRRRSQASAGQPPAPRRTIEP